MALSNVLVFDETDKQLFSGAICEGVRRAGAVALPVDDIGIALGDLEGGVNALVTTLSPFDTGAVAEVPKPLELIRKAHELQVPLGMVSLHPLARTLIRPDSRDVIFNSHLGYLDEMPIQVATWLGKLGLMLRPPKTGKNYEIKESPMAEAAGSLLGSEPKMHLGIWIANWDAEGGDFSAAQIIELVQLPSTSVGKNLSTFCSLGMLKRNEALKRKDATYTKVNSPLWEIYLAAQRAISTPNGQTDSP